MRGSKMDDPVVLHAAIKEYVEIIRELNANKHIGIYVWGVLIVVFMVTFSLFIGYAVLKPEIDHVKSVAEWNDVFDVNCTCGQHIHCEPYDKEHYKIECAKCGLVYEKDWDVWQKEIDNWKYFI